VLRLETVRHAVKLELIASRAGWLKRLWTGRAGIWLGTPALTTRGMRQPEMQQVAGFIAEVLVDVEDADRQVRVAGKVREMGVTFPLYRERLLP